MWALKHRVQLVIFWFQLCTARGETLAGKRTRHAQSVKIYFLSLSHFTSKIVSD